MQLYNEKEVNSYVLEALDYIQANAKLFDIFKQVLLDNELLIHSLNVSKLSTQLALALKLNDSNVFNICLGSLLHDVGKLEISKEILYKPDRLTSDEYEIVKTHTIKGYDLLKNTGVEKEAILIALRHHENCKGTGYPMGIVEDDLSIEIVSTADVLSALMESRTYHQAKSVTQALNYMSNFENLNESLLIKLSEFIKD